MKEGILNNHIINPPIRKLGFTTVLSLVFLILFGSCKVKKQLIVTQVKKSDTAIIVNDKIVQIQAGQTSYETFTGKARAKLDMGDNKYDVTFNIRIKNNEKVWISVTALAGIEAARILITPDSIWLINRLQGVYFKKPLSYFKNLAGNDLNFKAIGALLIGNIIDDILNNKGAISTRTDTTQLTGSINSMDYSLLINKNLKPLQTVLTNLNKGQELQITNSGDFMVGNKIIPEQIDIKVLTSTKKIQLGLHYLKADFNQPVEFPFTIPESYHEVQ